MKTNIEKIAERVLKNLTFLYRHNGCSPVQFISPDLSQFIGLEIVSIYTELWKNLSSTQREVASTREFFIALPGTLVMDKSDDSATIITRKGFNTTKLTKIYFDCLDSAMIKNHTIKGLEVIKCSLLENIFAIQVPESTKTYYATHDTLKSDLKNRKKKIIFEFFMELIKQANEDQLQKMVEELKSDNYIAEELSLHLSSFKSLLVKSSPTSFLYHYSQSEAIKRLAHLKYSLGIALKSAIPCCNLIRLANNPLETRPTDLLNLLQKNKSGFIATYALYEDKLFYIGDISNIIPLQASNIAALKRIFPAMLNEIKAVPTRLQTVIQLLTRHQLNPIPELPSDIHKRLRFFLDGKDINRLACLNNKTAAVKETKDLTETYGRGEEFSVYHFS